jgi:hypothetical protein
MNFLYPTSNGELQPFEVCPVTIGIGLLCDGGDTAILASDMRVTYGASPVSPNDSAGKQYDFPPYLLAAMIAGRASINQSVVAVMADELCKLLAAKQKQPDGAFLSDHVRKIVNFARKQELRKLQDCAMEGELGTNLHNWQSGNLPNDHKMDDLALRWGLTILDRVKRKLSEQLALIVVGFADNGVVFLRTVGAEPIEDTAAPECYVIGSGSVAAMEVLTKRKQHVDTTLARSLLHIYEALKAARRIEKTVGPPAPYMVIRRRNTALQPGMWVFPAESHLVRTWSKIYRERADTGSLDKALPNEQAIALLRKHLPRQSQVLTHETVKLKPLEMRLGIG